MQTEPIITNAEDTRRAASAGVDLWLEIDGRRFHSWPVPRREWRSDESLRC